MLGGDPYRNQYLLTTKRVEEKLQGWSKNIFDNRSGLTLFSHPSLSMETVSENTVTVSCVGYILDPITPTKTTTEIISEIANEIESGTKIAEVISRYTGRYVLILDEPNNHRIVPDAGALRPVLYGEICGDIVVTSSVKLVQDKFEISPKLSDSKRNYISQADWWIGTGTDDDRLARLLANHQLNLDDLSQVRLPYYLPSIDDPIQHSSRLLSGSIQAFVDRFENPQLWLSGGLDSRTLLAASKPVSDEIQYIVFERPDVEKSDVRIAQQLGKELNLNVKAIELEPVSNQFRKNLNMAFCSPRVHSAQANVEWSGEQKIDEQIVISGLVSEVSRTYYEHPTKELSVDLCHTLGHLPETKYSFEELEKWLQSAAIYEEESSINLYDLFYWEQKISNWGARAAREIDLVAEMGAPFANRELLHTLLSTPRDDRRPPRYRTTRGIIQNCWSDCLDIPINPSESMIKNIKSYMRDRSQTSLLHYKLKQAYLAIR